ncbi:proline dehydrogenase [Bradyrhizobium sp. LM6.10]
MPNIPPPFSAAYAPDDAEIAARLLPAAHLNPPQEARIDRTATRLIEAIRKRDDRLGGVEDMLREFALSTKEGLALMVLAEALLRVPDARTARTSSSRTSSAKATSSITRPGPPPSWSTPRPGRSASRHG